jgi:hypothetical protein
MADRVKQAVSDLRGAGTTIFFFMKLTAAVHVPAALKGALFIGGTPCSFFQ